MFMAVMMAMKTIATVIIIKRPIKKMMKMMVVMTMIGMIVAMLNTAMVRQATWW